MVAPVLNARVPGLCRSCADGCTQPAQVVPGQRGVRTEAHCRVGGAGCGHEGRDARDKQEALVEVLDGMHGGR